MINQNDFTKVALDMPKWHPEFQRMGQMATFRKFFNQTILEKIFWKKGSGNLVISTTNSGHRKVNSNFLGVLN